MLSPNLVAPSFYSLYNLLVNIDGHDQIDSAGDVDKEYVYFMGSLLQK